MTTSDHPVAWVQDDVRCNICKEIYDDKIHIPKILPCHHTFCRVCLHSKFSSAFSIECSLCSAKCNRPAKDFTTNHAILDVAKKFVKQVGCGMKCSTHSDVDSLQVCMDCLMGICMDCVMLMGDSPHCDHQLETPENAKILLQQQFTAMTEEKQSTLNRKMAILDRGRYSVEGVSKQESEIKRFYANLESFLTEWHDEQLEEIDKLKKETVERKQQYHEQDEKLKKLLNEDLDSETLITKLKQEENGDQLPSLCNIPDHTQIKSTYPGRCIELSERIQEFVAREVREYRKQEEEEELHEKV